MVRPRKSVARNAASSTVAATRVPDRLQSEITERERELQWLYAVRDAQRQHGKKGSSTSHNNHGAHSKDTRTAWPWHRELRIRNSIRETPLGEMGTPESVAFALTGEARYLDGPAVNAPTTATTTLAQRPVYFGWLNTASLAAAQAAPTSVTHEFAERLSRLRRGVVGAQTLSEGAAVISNVTTRASLELSPIAQTRASIDRSYEGQLWVEGSADLFNDDDTVTDTAVSTRHVRFSSKSPQVAVFSVERSGSRGATPQLTEMGQKRTIPDAGLCSSVHQPASKAAESPSSEEHSLLFVGEEETPPRRSTAGSEDMVQLSRISMQPSPRSSVESYLSVLGQLRSSLLNPRGSAVQSECPILLQSSTGECGKGPVSKTSAVAETNVLTGSNDSPFAPSVGTTTGCSHSTSGGGGGGESAQPPPSFRCTKRPRDDCPEEQLAEHSDPSPIFLQRPQRCKPTATALGDTSAATVQLSTVPTDDACFQESKTAAAAAATAAVVEVAPPPSSSAFTDITNRTPNNAARVAKRSPAEARAAKQKKTVRFRPSVEQLESCPAADGTTATGRRKRRCTRRSQQASTVAAFPANMQVEERGFGAGIHLACGPTLHFD